jgi:hypothetical protein
MYWTIYKYTPAAEKGKLTHTQKRIPYVKL